MNNYNRPMTVLLLCFLLLFLPGCREQNEAHGEPVKNPQETTLYVISDTHLLSSSINDGKSAFLRYSTGGDGKNLRYMEKILQQFQKEVEKGRPDYLIVSGDLTNNGEKASHEELRTYFQEMETLGTEVLVIPGNHDILNPHARGFQGDWQQKVPTVTPEEFAGIYKDFGYGEALYRDQASLSYVYEVREDLWVLMMDTNKYKKNLDLGYPEAGGILSLETFSFMRRVLDEALKKRIEVISVSHHNSLLHSPIAVEDYILDNEEEYLNILRSRKVQLNLTGHIHIQDIQENLEETPYYEIASGALSVYPHKYGILTYAQEKGIDYTARKVPLTGIMAGSALKDFETLDVQSRTFFAKNSSARILTRLLEEEGETPEEAKLMAEAVGELNVLYFGGEEHLFTETLLSHEGVQLLLKRKGTRTSHYVDRMLQKEGPDDNHLFLPWKLDR